MANPSVTYTFSNSTTADATQVNQNFTDLINGATDGTKDYSISALTVAGTATLNGNVNLGNASGDDLSITASLATSIPIKTNASFDIGAATLGLAGIYLGSAASKTTRVIGAATANYTLTLPTTAGTARYRVETDGSGVLSFQPKRRTPDDIQNHGIAASVATSALTLALKGSDGADPSATNPVDIVFRSATLATGTPVTRTVTGALSVVLSSGSTLGMISARAGYGYLYAIDNAGTVELAVSGVGDWDEGILQTTTAEGGAGAADSGSLLYSTTARSNVAVRLIGRFASTQATAGTWATAISEISLAPSFTKTRQIEVGVAQTSTSSRGGTTYGAMTNPIVVSFVARHSCKYKVWANVIATAQNAGALGGLIVQDTAGTPVIIFQQTAIYDNGDGNNKQFSPYSIYQLTAGTSYTFAIYGRASAGNMLCSGGVDNGNTLIAEQME